jgi:hypothetical protein
MKRKELALAIEYTIVAVLVGGSFLAGLWGAIRWLIS